MEIIYRLRKYQDFFQYITCSNRYRQFFHIFQLQFLIGKFGQSKSKYYNKQSIILKTGMSWLICCSQPPPTTSGMTRQPLKFQLLRSLNLMQPILNMLVLPKKKNSYTFPRHRLQYLSYNETNHIPIIYFPSKDKELLLIYCHGSGSNLNNVYNFGGNLMNMYGISVLLYDYTGDGESQRQFCSYQSDVKVVLAWAVKEGYDLDKVILCGFSIGSYSALVLQGPMPRMLISPICGIIPFIQGTNIQYEGQLFDNLQNAQKIEARTIILHGSNQMIPYSHAEAIVDSLRTKNKPETIQLLRVDGVDHLQMPNTLLSKQAQPILTKFYSQIKQDSNCNKGKYKNKFDSLKKQLLDIGSKIVVQRSLKKQ